MTVESVIPSGKRVLDSEKAFLNSKITFRRCSRLTQHLFEPRFIEVEHDRAVDIERGCDELAVAPCPYLLLRAGHSIDVDLGLGQAMCRQPFACRTAILAPLRAVHHDAAVRQVNRLGLGRFASSGLRVDAPQLRKKDLVIGLRVEIMDVDVSDHTFTIEDEEGAFGITFRSEHAIFLGDLTVWPEIAEQGIADVAETLRPRFQNGYMIDADAQNLGIQSRELGKLCLVRRDLVASDGCEGLWEEGQYDILTSEVAQGHVLVEVTG